MTTLSAFPGPVLPPMNNPRVGEEAEVTALLAAVKSPKSTASPSDWIVT